jgi:hypothetical protein
MIRDRADMPEPPHLIELAGLLHEPASCVTANSCPHAVLASLFVTALRNANGVTGIYTGNFATVLQNLHLSIHLKGSTDSRFASRAPVYSYADMNASRESIRRAGSCWVRSMPSVFAGSTRMIKPREGLVMSAMTGLALFARTECCIRLAQNCWAALGIYQHLS